MNVLEYFAPVRTFVFDIDGVLTDGNLLLMEDGQLLRTMNVKDGYALQLAVKKGYAIWIISETKSEAVRVRLHKMGITEIHMGIENKKEFLERIVRISRTAYHSMLYMGDDMADHEAMQLCGVPCCPADSVAEVQQAAQYVSPYAGGKGCVRDVIEKVLKLNNHWEGVASPVAV